MSPHLVVCGNCGVVLWESEGQQVKSPNKYGVRMIFNLKYPDEVIAEYDGRCPLCGHKLEFHGAEVKAMQK